MTDDGVQYEVKGPIATIWINRPEVKNRPRVLELLGEYAHKAEELMLTGKLLSGSEAKEWGLVNEVAEPDDFDAMIERFCEPLVDKSPFCIWITKMPVNRGLDADTDSLITLETLACNVVRQSEDAKEGVAAFLEKRTPNWVGR